MKFETFTLPHITGGTHTENKARMFIATISVDIHTKHTTQNDALEYIYCDALMAGAGTYTREQFLHTLGLTGGSISATVSRGVLTISVRSLTEQAMTILKLTKAMLESPSFVATEIARIKKNVHNDLELQKEDAKGKAHRNLQNALFGNADRRRSASVSDLQKAVAAVTKVELQAMHERTLTEPWTITISGDKKTIDAAKKMARTLKGARTPSTKAPAHEPKQISKRTVLTESIPSKHNVEFSIGAPLPLTLHHPDFLPFVFGLSVLGKWGGFAGRLMSTVREKEGLTYGIYARAESVYGSEAGYWRIMTFFAPEKAKTGLTSTLREITSISQKGVTDKEMGRFKAILNTQQALLNDSLLGSLGDLHGYISEGFTLDSMVEYKARLLSVTKKEVNAALKKYLNPNQLVISAAGPVAKINKELKQFVK